MLRASCEDGGSVFRFGHGDFQRGSKPLLPPTSKEGGVAKVGEVKVVSIYGGMVCGDVDADFCNAVFFRGGIVCHF